MMNITSGDCVACGACVSVCPRNSISLEQDSTGFYKPVVDPGTCVDCGKCRKVCPVEHRLPGQDWTKGEYYGLWALDRQQRQAGSSGGAFGLLAEDVLDSGGVVFGAAYSADHRSVRQVSTDAVPLASLKKSKYVESYTGTVFRDVKAALEAGRQVLYCGTACQIDGLKNYLGGDREGLLTCDFLCHGVPAAGVFEKYITGLEKKYGKITAVDFRSKAYGWKAYCARVTFASGRVYLKTLYRDPYLRIFFENTALREACFSCRRLHESNADITLGDFWRVGQMPQIPDTNEGISLVGVHTEKGRQALEKLTGETRCFAQLLPRERYAYAYDRASRKPSNRAEKLAAIMKCEKLTDLPAPAGNGLRAIRYHIKALLQKSALRRNK